MITKNQQTTAWMKIGLWVATVAMLGAGCEWSAGGGTEAEESEMSSVPIGTVSLPETTATATPSPSASWPAEITGPIHWLHADVSGWAQTANLQASVGGGSINLSYDKAKVWPAMGGANANPWVIVNLNGQWYAGTFEWLRYGQTAKPMSVLSGGGHIKVPPLSSWRPRSGERIGLMVSGLARDSTRNVQERSNVVMVTWP